MQLAWEGRADASSFFFPPDDFDRGPSPAPAMLSCTALDTTAATGLPRLSPTGELLSASPSDAASPSDGADQAASSCCLPGAGGGAGDSKRNHEGVEEAGVSFRQGVQATGRMSSGEEKSGGIAREAAAGEVVGVGDERRGEPGGGGAGGRQNKSGKTATGISVLRPYVIDLKREVKLRVRGTGIDPFGVGSRGKQYTNGTVRRQTVIS